MIGHLYRVKVSFRHAPFQNISDFDLHVSWIEPLPRPLSTPPAPIASYCGPEETNGEAEEEHILSRLREEIQGHGPGT